jgi:GNAT superfamily N-acetyltransferase
MQWTKDDFIIITDKDKIDIDFVHNFLTQSYWAKGISKSIVERSIEGSICFVILHYDRQVGFARVITDSATFAYLADVFVDESYRGKGLSRWLMYCILSHQQLQGLRRFLLATRDAHGLYEKVGFERIQKIEPWMQIHNPEVYKQKEGTP